MTSLGQDDHLVCPHMSHDFDLSLTFDLYIGVNAKNINPTIATYIDRSWLILVRMTTVCPPMSHDFDLHLTFDLDIGVNVKNIVNPAVDWPPLLHILIDRD